MAQCLCHWQYEEAKEHVFVARINWGSLLTRQDASTLHALMCRRAPHQYLFSDATLIKNAVWYALRQQNPLSALPSLRKGAALHMAAMKVPQLQIMLMTRSYTPGYTIQISGLWPPADIGGHNTAEDNAGHVLFLDHTNWNLKALDAINLGVNEVELHNLIRQMNN